MYIVSGCPRSGTSLMMRILEAALLGSNRILQDTHTQIDRPELSEIQKYIASKRRPNQIQERAKDMNPNGYYEMAFCVQGVNYRFGYEDLLKKIENEETKSVCKIVSQGLIQSDPKYIDKIIYMLRNPKSVAKSQERLGRQNPMSPENAPKHNGKNVLIRSVQMFNQVSYMAAKWITKHPDIPVLVVDYDDLILNQKENFDRLAKFLGEGIFFKADSIIDPKLRRSHTDEEPHDDTEVVHIAQTIYNFLGAGDFQAVIDYVDMKRGDFKKKKPEKYFCCRSGVQVSSGECALCKTHDITIKNKIKSTEKKKIDWRNEPCTLDCLNGMSVQQSILNNHWTGLDLFQKLMMRRKN